MASYKFKGGAEVKGSVEEILSFAKSIGETVDLSKLGERAKGFYPSTSKGLIKISDMNDTHIRAALLKLSKTYFDDLAKESRGILSNKDFLKKFVALGNDLLVEELFAELAKR